MILKKLTIFLTALMLAPASFALSSYEKDLASIIKSGQSDTQKAKKLFKATWDHNMATFPEWATYVGYPGYNSKWTDNSESAIAQRGEDKKATLKAIQSIQRKNLKGEDQLSYDLFLKDAQREVDGLKFHDELLPINQMFGIHIDIPDLMWNAPKNSVNDYNDMIQRLQTAPKIISQVKALLQKGIQEGITQPQIVMKSTPSQIDDILKKEVTQSPLYLPFAEIKLAISDAEKKRIQTQALEAITNQVYPALKDFKSFLAQTYLPNCREQVGFASLKGGAEWYAFKAKTHTTVNMSPEEIHQLGLREVDRITKAMLKIKDQLKFKGDLKAFNKFMKTDRQFFYTDPRDLMTGFRDIAKRIDPELLKIFGRLPRLTYGVREMPSYKAPSAPTAYYQGGSLEAGRAGTFEANTFDLNARPKWQMEALTLHEAVPGHHLQISLAQEIEGLPDFRKNTGPTSFVEGWGLYAESLGEELGMYQDPYSKYGQLTFEIWRAVRLVVDTGLHAKSWSRDQVIQYFKDNSPISEQQIVNETDRYIADPGQALAYKIGELKFKELRQTAQASLGDKFSIREFHDQLLGSGALPMDIIEKKMLAWVENKKSTSKPSKNAETVH